MKARSVNGIIGAAVLLSFSVVSGTAGAVTPDSVPPGGGPYCNATVDAPHTSSGAGGIIVKSRSICYGNVAQARFGLDLFQCPRKPTGDKDTWGSQGCSVVKVGGRVVNSAVDGATYTTYAPNVGTAGAHGTRWWAGVAITTVYNSAGTNIGHGHTLGPAVELTG